MPDYREAEQKQLDELIDHFYLEMIDLLGKRTAEMHLAISSAKEDPDFVPEPFSLALPEIDVPDVPDPAEADLLRPAGQPAQDP